jgi:dihydropteroate synthase
MNRKICYWKLRRSELQLGERTLIMGILNVTPDSFSDGGRFNDPDRAYARALELEEEGADIIDIGAESTKPGSQRISAEEEWQRLVPVLKRLRDQLRVPLSLDTYKSDIAERALDYGIEIINDPSGLTFDPNVARVAAASNAGLVLSHMRGTPETWAKLPPLPDAADTITRELEATVNRARGAGVERSRIVIDPGLGFGKRKEQNSEVLAHLRELARLECPVLIGPSRKAFLMQPTEGETVIATAAAVTAGILNGAHIVRVHDVKAMRAAVLIADEVARAARVLTRSEREEAERQEARQEARKLRTVARPFEPERYSPTRPPIAKRVPEPVEAPPPVVEAAEALSEASSEALSEAAEAPSTPPPPPAQERPAARPSARPPARPRDGSAPPMRRSFESRPPRKDYGADRAKPAGREDRPPRRFGDRDDRGDRAPRSGPPRGDRPDRAPRTGPPRGDRPDRGPRTGPPFGDRPDRGPRTGPPRGDRPDRGPRTGPPRGDRPDRGPRTGPPRGDRPDRGPRTGPPRGDRPDRGPRTGPPRGDSPRSGPPRSGPPHGDRPDRGSKRPGFGSGGPGGRPPKRPFRKRP